MSDKECLFNIRNVDSSYNLIPTVKASYIEFTYNTHDTWILEGWSIGWGTVDATEILLYDKASISKATVYLNSPLLKGDEIVCKEDGLYHYHKMGKVVLDGSDDEKWGMPNSQPDNTSRFYWLNIAPGGVNGANTICDKSPTKSGAMADMLGIWVDANIILNVPKTVTTIDECKLLLSSNPITVVYELAEP